MIVVLAKKDKHLQNTIELLAEIKNILKSNERIKEVCEEYNHDIDIIDGVPLDFKDNLGASAKTINSKIFLSDELIDKPIEIAARYAVHEFIHALQHMDRYNKKDPYEDKEYLDRPDEIEAFQHQIGFEAEVVGKEEAEEYVDELLDYHSVPKKERDSKKEELMDEVE